MKRNSFFAVSIFLIFFTSVFSSAYDIKRSGIYPRIITPNGDGRNDVFFVKYSNPYDNEIQAKIFTTGGSEVAVMSINEVEDYFYWDGRDSSGSVVPPGVYVFQVTGDGRTYNGTVIVCR